MKTRQIGFQPSAEVKAEEAYTIQQKVLDHQNRIALAELFPGAACRGSVALSGRPLTQSPFAGLTLGGGK